jgi:hypothetical protein
VLKETGKDVDKLTGTFLSSHKSGRWRRIASGAVSAANTIISETPLLRVLVAKGTRNR